MLGQMPLFQVCEALYLPIYESLLKDKDTAPKDYVKVQDTWAALFHQTKGLSLPPRDQAHVDILGNIINAELTEFGTIMRQSSIYDVKGVARSLALCAAVIEEIKGQYGLR